MLVIVWTLGVWRLAHQMSRFIRKLSRYTVRTEITESWRTFSLATVLLELMMDSNPCKSMRGRSSTEKL